MFKKSVKISKFDKRRLEQLEQRVKDFKAKYTTITEALFISDVCKQPPKQPYPSWHAWKLKHEELMRKYRYITKEYEKAVISLYTLKETIDLENFKEKD